MGRVVAGLEVELIGGAWASADAPDAARVHRLCVVVAAAAGVQDGHVAVELVTAGRIAALNGAHRGKPQPTDVLSFPIDGVDGLPSGVAGSAGVVERAGGAASEGVPRELGDVVICPAYTADLCEAIVHGVLHLVGMDHELDDGEMLALQAEILRWETL